MSLKTSFRNLETKLKLGDYPPLPAMLAESLLQ